MPKESFRLLSEVLSINPLPHTPLFIRVKNSFCVGKLVFNIFLYATKSKIVSTLVISRCVANYSSASTDTTLHNPICNIRPWYLVHFKI